MDFVILADHRVKLKESEKKDKYLDLAREMKKKTVEHENGSYASCNWCSWYSDQRIATKTWELGNKRTSRSHACYSIAEIGQNTEKSPEELKRVAVVQTSVKAISSRWCETLKKRVKIKIITPFLVTVTHNRWLTSRLRSCISIQ